MKKVFYYISILLLSIHVSSCVQDVDDLFDASSSARVEQAAKDFDALLHKPANGWLMEYYPQSNQIYGGFVFALKFGEESKVDVSGVLFGKPDEVYQSLYSIKKDKNISLNFDSYNQIFHYLSDPDPHVPGTYSLYGYYENMTRGKGYEGDYEFFLVSSSDDEIILQGKKTGNIIRMTPLEETASSYLSKVMSVMEETSSIPAISGLTATIDGKDLTLFSYGGVGSYMPASYDDKSLGNASVLVTSDGLKFYSPIKVGDKSISNLVYNSTDKTFACTDNGATDVVFSLMPNPKYLTYEDYIGSYKIAYDKITTKAVTITAKEEGKTLLLNKPFSTKYSVVLDYEPITGSVSIHPQAVATNGSMDIWICSYDADQGRLSWNESTGMQGTWNGDRENFVISFSDNGASSSINTTGFYYRSFDAGTQNNGAHFNGFGEYYACKYFYSLTKK